MNTPPVIVLNRDNVPVQGCGKQPVIGNCQSYSQQWYFDSDLSRCHTFLYSGCGGNENRFMTQDDCLRSCTTVQTEQMSPLIICFIAFSAFIAFMLLIFLIVLIYNLCRYGTCCPPSGNPICCCCCWWRSAQPLDEEIEIVKPTRGVQTVRSLPSASGTYVRRGKRFNPTTYVMEPRAISTTGTLRAGRMPSTRNSVVFVGDETVPRRSIMQAVRPQIFLSDGYSDTARRSSMRRNLVALPSSSQGSIRCFARNEPVVSGNLSDDTDVRVIVRNQPYASQRQMIIEAPIEMSSSISPPPTFETAMGFGGGVGGGGMEQIIMGDGLTNGNYAYGGLGQHSATIDVCYDQVPDYTSDDGVQFQQTTMYPTLTQPNFY